MTVIGDSDGRPTGPWQSRVRFGPGGGFAYRPGEVMVATEEADQAEERLAAWAERRPEEQPVDLRRIEGLIAESFVRFAGAFELREVLEELRSEGVSGQPNHVLFATSCCPPHPSDPMAEQFYANPYYANPYYANAPRSPFMDSECRHSGVRTSSARPASASRVTNSQARCASHSADRS